MNPDQPGSLRTTAATLMMIGCCFFSTMVNAQNGHKTPKLILQITVDQLRGDLPTRYYDRLGEGGIKYLWESGIVYRNAHHAHANTETIVGHATLATGANPPIMAWWVISGSTASQAWSPTMLKTRATGC